MSDLESLKRLASRQVVYQDGADILDAIAEIEQLRCYRDNHLEVAQRYRELDAQLQKALQDVARYKNYKLLSEGLEKERDQLKSIINVVDSKIPLTPNTFGGSYMIMFEQSDIDLLRQKALEPQP